MTLWDLAPGTSCTVNKLLPELPDNYRKRLVSLGFQPGGSVASILAPSLGAPRLYRVENTVYSLDDAVARLISVEPHN